MAKSNLTVDMDGNEAKLWRALQTIVQGTNEVEQGFDGITKKAGETERKHQQLERTAKRVYESTRTGQEKYNQRLTQLNELLAKGKINQDTYGRAVAKAKVELNAAGKAGQKAFGQKALESLSSLKGGLVGAGGITAAVGTVRKAYGNWLQDMREVTAEARSASGEIVAFAALQEGGTKAERVMRAADLAAKYGVTERGEAFNTVQALQSARGGDFEAGLRAAETVFAGSQVGIPVDRGTELEVLSAAQGEKPGQGIRRAYVGGQAASRDPSLLATAASGQKYFPDKDFGVAVAAVLAGSREKSQLPSYHRQAGMGLSGVSPAQEWFEEKGLGKASQADKLRGLAKHSIDTVEELTEIGFKEIRMRDAMMDLVANVETVDRFRKAIHEKAKPGIFQRHRAGIEKELPVMRTTREIGIVETTLANEMALGKAAGPAAKADQKQANRALALHRMDRRTSAFNIFDLIEGEGKNKRSTRFDVMLGAGMEEVTPAAKRVIGSALLPLGVGAALPFMGNREQGAEGFMKRLGTEETKIYGELQRAAPGAARVIEGAQPGPPVSRGPGPNDQAAADIKQAAETLREAGKLMLTAAKQMPSGVDHLASSNPTLGSPLVDT